MKTDEAARGAGHAVVDIVSPAEGTGFHARRCEGHEQVAIVACSADGGRGAVEAGRGTRYTHVSSGRLEGGGGTGHSGVEALACREHEGGHAGSTTTVMGIAETGHELARVAHLLQGRSRGTSTVVADARVEKVVLRAQRALLSTPAV